MKKALPLVLASLFLALVAGLLSPASAESTWPPTPGKPAFCKVRDDACKAWKNYIFLDKQITENPQAAIPTVTIPFNSLTRGYASSDDLRRWWDGNRAGCRITMMRQLSWANYDWYKANRDAFTNQLWAGYLLDRAEPFSVFKVGNQIYKLVLKKTKSKAQAKLAKQGFERSGLTLGYSSVLDSALKVGLEMKRGHVATRYFTIQQACS